RPAARRRPPARRPAPTRARASTRRPAGAPPPPPPPPPPPRRAVEIRLGIQRPQDVVRGALLVEPVHDELEGLVSTDGLVEGIGSLTAGGGDSQRLGPGVGGWSGIGLAHGHQPRACLSSLGAVSPNGWRAVGPNGWCAVFPTGRRPGGRWGTTLGQASRRRSMIAPATIGTMAH